MDSGDRDTWRRIDVLLEEALERAPSQRRQFVEAASDDLSVRHELESLLAASTPSDELFHVLNARNSTTAGRLVGSYRLLEVIGRGGMGTVYLAERADGQFQQRVAVKLLRGGLVDDEAERRFRLERQILARLEHPNIARLLDGGVTSEGQPYFVIEHVVGQSVTEYCDSHRLGLDQRLEIFRTVCAAVEYAHQHLVVHRDLKPANILVTDDGKVKLLDFGIARVLDTDAFDQTLALTRSDARLMTPDYASPEQVRGEAITTATDVYGLGILLYELLTGRRPYVLAGRRLEEIERVVCEQMPTRPSAVAGLQDSTADTAERARARNLSSNQLQRRLRGDLDNIVLLALRKEPERRYRSVHQLSEDAWRHLHRLPVRARGDTFLYRASKFTRRHAVGLSASALVALALIGGMFTTVFQARLARLERERAEHINTFLEGMLASADPLGGDPNVTVAQVLARAALEADSTLEGRPDIEAGVRTTLGRTFQQLRRYPEAESQLRRALALQKSLRQGEHADVARGIRNLAELQRKRLDDVGADSLYREALGMQQRLFGRSHAEVATTLDRLATLRHEQGDLPAADDYYTRSLAMRRRLFGESHVDVAETLDNLGILRYEQGDFVAAESLGRRSLALNRELRGPQHVYVKFSLNNTARALKALGRYRDAEALYRESLTLLRQRVGEQHTEVAATLENLASTVMGGGDYTAAEAIYRESLAMRRQLLGEDHLLVTWSLHNLAMLLDDKGDYPGAERHYREVAVRDERLLASKDPVVSNSLGQLARLLRKTGRRQTADSIYRRVIAIDRRYRGAQDPTTAHHLVGWAALRADMGHAGEADSLFRAALTALRTTVRPDGPFLLDAQLAWGRLLVTVGRIAEAEPLLQAAVSGSGALRGLGDRFTIESHLWLGRCLAALERYDEAEALLQESHRAAMKRDALRREYAPQTLDALVDLYTRWNKPREAATYRALLAPINGRTPRDASVARGS